MNTGNAIADLLAAPLSPKWTIEGLAEQLLCTIAGCRIGESHELILPAGAGAHAQVRRLLRPLLACLATKSAAEAGIAPNLYGGDVSFKRTGSEGPVWVLGQFENRPGMVRICLQRSASPSAGAQSRIEQPIQQSTEVTVAGTVESGIPRDEDKHV